MTPSKPPTHKCPRCGKGAATPKPSYARLESGKTKHMTHEFFESPNPPYKTIDIVEIKCLHCGLPIRFPCPPKLSSDQHYIKFLEERLSYFQRKNIELEIALSRAHSICKSS